MAIEQRKLLITGCARSGTLYASRLWQALGLDIRHERPVPPDGRMGKDGIASWLMAVKDPCPPYGPSALKFNFDFIIHQVRHPLKVIPSIAQFIIRANGRGKKYILTNCPEVELNTEQKALEPHEQWILQAALYWHYWNLMVENIATVTVSLENLSARLPLLCEMLGIQYNSNVVETIPKNINSRTFYIKEKPWKLEWGNLEKLHPPLTEKIKLQASRYGCN